VYSDTPGIDGGSTAAQSFDGTKQCLLVLQEGQ